MVRKYYKLTCNCCNKTEQIAADNDVDFKDMARDKCWIITRRNTVHYCSKTCQEKGEIK